MSFTNLPEDLVVEILSRVPAVSLARVRSTSKRWNALIKDGRILAKKHFANAPRQSLALVLIDHRVYSVRFNRGIPNNGGPCVNVTCHFSLKDPLSSEEVDILRVFHCDGLLLCRTNDKRLVVWNPCSGETRWIQPRDSYKKGDFYALGRSSCNKYKILRLEYLIDPSQECYEYKILNLVDDPINCTHDRYEYEIYDFTSNSWRVVGVTTDLFNPDIIGNGISVNGVTYWVNTRQEVLVSFDFSTERFDSVYTPEFDNPLALSVTGQGQKLCMLSTQNSYDVTERNVNLWIATKSENTRALSWNKFPIFQGFGLRYRLFFREGVSFFAYQKKEETIVVSCHEPNRFSKNIIHIVTRRKFFELDHHGAKPSYDLSPTPRLFIYVPSLVQIQDGI